MPEYKFNSMNYLSGGVVTVGPVKKKTYFVDGSDAYANNRKLFISFHHVPTGKDVPLWAPDVHAVVPSVLNAKGL